MEKERNISPDQEIDFCTLGMFIIDEIHYPPPRTSVTNILGGAGTFAAIGARLFSPPPLSKRISWIVDAGSDFPPSLIALIHFWETSVLLRHNTSRLTTRGCNRYDKSEKRDFTYLTPKLRLGVSDLESRPANLLSKSYHFICSPLRCISLVTDLLHARKDLDPHAPKPIIVWEPIPDLCVPSELLNLTNCLPYVDICSPNSNELLSFLSEPLASDSSNDTTDDLLDTSAVEEACEQLLAAMPLQTYALVIRCGPHGAYVAKNGGRSRRPSRRPSDSGCARQKRPANHARGGLTPDTDMEALFVDFNADINRGPLPVDPGTSLWLPAYIEKKAKVNPQGTFEDMRKESMESVEVQKGKSVLARDISSKKDPPQVVDPTGAGNSFLGALSVALARGKFLEEAVCWGMVAASFVIEQVGVPFCSSSNDHQSEKVEDEQNLSLPTESQNKRGEIWNGERVFDRLDDFLQRVRRDKHKE